MALPQVYSLHGVAHWPLNRLMGSLLALFQYRQRGARLFEACQTGAQTFWLRLSPIARVGCLDLPRCWHRRTRSTWVRDRISFQKVLASGVWRGPSCSRAFALGIYLLFLSMTARLYTVVWTRWSRPNQHHRLPGHPKQVRYFSALPPELNCLEALCFLNRARVSHPWEGGCHFRRCC